MATGGIPACNETRYIRISPSMASPRIWSLAKSPKGYLITGVVLYSETFLERPLPCETTGLTGPHVPGRRWQLTVY